ncbi:putative c2h2 transcription [Diaporthe ampelina]|uniref:Putative c2h2 transcription n=1 Tax=Diaporthe ampelina TaxID=1214573 RepID=A0A0G2FEH8_9PEZI|nr:putative c2h2 transcription [Diaporthe ampelina]
MQAPINQPTLEKALRVLYVEKRLLKNTGDFARVLLIHGLYCQTWDVGTLLNRPLLRWYPSSQKGDAESHDLTGPAWLPQIPLYNQWRNAACDCLDVLHWIANSDIAKAGTENSTVLHLHFARIVLLAPYKAIRTVAELLVSEDDSRDGDAVERFQRECQQVRKWIADDQFKARLALVHCGIFFWHVRRYSLDAFYEPTKVFLVTLVVWAYGSLCPPQQASASLRGPSRSSGNRPREDEDWSCDLDDISSIRLDRPCDDELVQLFIKRGRSMTATIMGVGNITAANGPLRMLKEGRKLLSTLDKWPIRDRYLQLLTQLVDVCGQNAQWVQAGASLGQTRREAPS